MKIKTLPYTLPEALGECQKMLDYLERVTISQAHFNKILAILQSEKVDLFWSDGRVATITEGSGEFVIVPLTASAQVKVLRKLGYRIIDL